MGLTDTLFRKDIVLRNWYDRGELETGLEATHRISDNNEDYCSLMGTKPQINRYLQNADIVSDRLRTLNNVPKWRIINSKKIRIQ